MRRTSLARPGCTTTALPLSSFSRRSFYSGLDPKKFAQLRQSGMCYNKPRGRDSSSLNFEKAISVQSMGQQGVASLCENWGPEVCVVEPVSLNDLQLPIAHPSRISAYAEARLAEYPSSCVRNLRQNGDSWAHTVEVPASAQEDGQQQPPQGRVKRHVISVVDPDLRHRKFRREEAQVELISAFRNILFDFYDLQVASTLRIPVLALGQTTESLSEELAKLSQQAMIKGFHRVPTNVKEWYCSLPGFRLEFYAPMPVFEEFEQAFLEEAWPIPDSIWNPGRLALYPGLTPPPQLLQLPGFTGGRQEILDAPATDGRSLEGVPRFPDGTEAQKVDALGSASAWRPSTSTKKARAEAAAKSAAQEERSGARPVHEVVKESAA